jgi:hypothetical protein
MHRHAPRRPTGRLWPLLLPLALLPASPASGADLTLLRAGSSDYEIVLPDTAEPESIARALEQSARLLQTAFAANGPTIAVVPETRHDRGRPAIFLGNTRFARDHGIDVSQFNDWRYVHRAVGRDIVIAGHDHPARGPTTNPRRPNWDRVGTAKGVVDFARTFLGTRFLYPDIPSYTPLGGAAGVDLLASPSIEYLPLDSIAVPGDLDVRATPAVRLNTAHPAGCGFYDLAHNRFPRVDEQYGSHTWERAVPIELFADHPEYFALVNGTRLKPTADTAQYCLSNPDVQERIYRDLAGWFDRGYTSVDLGQPDGFRPCECDACGALHGTGKDWGEKIWIFNRGVAERLARSHPGRTVTMMSYILTAAPPRTFTAFPANTSIMLTGTEESDFAAWRTIGVPRGYTSYLYNWCPNLATRYLPMRTPGFIETQVRRLASHGVQAILRDGPGQLFGLEGPVYYVMGRMLDAPESNTARDLLAEYCAAAFPEKAVAGHMRAFYDELFVAIALYSDHLGTRCDVWTFKPLPTDERARKTVQDPFQLIAFLYPPRVLASLEASLSKAETLATAPKERARLELIRAEFDYITHLARVAHLHQAWQAAPDRGSLDRLLDAIDARNAFIDQLYDPRRRSAWSRGFYPFPGHSREHLRLAYDGYQEPFAATCVNWDTAAMRVAEPAGPKRLVVPRVDAPPSLDAFVWERAAPHALTVVPPLHGLPKATTMRLLHDADALYVRVEAEAGEATAYPALRRDQSLANREAFDIRLAPRPAEPLIYRFTAGANQESRYDAVSGRIADAMDPRFGRDDPGWNGDWTSVTRVDAANRRWIGLLTIPFQTLGVEPPVAGASWAGNFCRTHALPRNAVDRAVWSSSPASQSMDDRTIFGEIVFE